MTDAVDDARLTMVRARNARGEAQQPKLKAAQEAYAALQKAADAFSGAMVDLGGQTAPMMAKAITDSVGHAGTVLGLEAQAVTADLAAA